MRACFEKPLFPYGTEAEIKACSRARGLPFTSEWAEIDPGIGGRYIQVVCLTPIPSKTKEGKPETIRVAVALQTVDGKHYPIDDRKLSYDTFDEAARSACAHKISWMAQHR